MSFKTNICVDMSFNIQRHIYTSVVFWCVCMDYFCDRVPCGSGQTSVILSLRGPVVGVCMHARAQTGLRTHVTFIPW